MNIKNLKVNKKAILGFLPFVPLIGMAVAPAGIIMWLDKGAPMPGDKEVVDNQIHAVIFGDDTATIIEPMDVEYDDHLMKISFSDSEEILCPMEKVFCTDKPRNEVEDLIRAYKGNDITINTYNYAGVEEETYEDMHAVLFGQDGVTFIPIQEAEYKNTVTKLGTEDGCSIVFSLDNMILSTLPEEELKKLVSCISDDDIYYYGEETTDVKSK